MVENFKDVFSKIKEAKEYVPPFFAKIEKSESVSKVDVHEPVEGRETKYPSTYKERLDQTPKKGGEWEGERGESKFIPNDPKTKDILDDYGLDGISYRDAIPDFSKVSESTVKIDNMTAVRGENFKQCDEQCAKQWNKEARDGKTDWEGRDVKNWRKDNDYSWHERNDMKMCDLVPTKINSDFGHLGGVSECIKRDISTNGGDFDE